MSLRSNFVAESSTLVPRPRRFAPRGGWWIGGGLALATLACAPVLWASPPQADPAARPVAVVTVQTRVLGRQIPRDFAGFSLEVSTAGQGIGAFKPDGAASAATPAAEQEVYAMGRPDAPNTGYFQFMRNLGPGVLRLGGNSQDNSCWDPAHSPYPKACEGVLTATDLALFSKAAESSGWKLILGLNLKQNSAAWALEELTQGVNREIKPDELMAVEIGNEPDLFSRTPYRPKTYSPAEHLKEFAAYANAFQANAAARRYAVAGPATCCSWRNGSGLGIFLRGATVPSLKLVTVHNYSATTCNGRTVTAAQLLAPSLMERYNREVQPLAAAARERGLPIAMAETNSASCGGMPGVSNSFAATVWALDYMLATAGDGFRLINFHSSYRPGGSSYNPVDTYASRNASGQWQYRNVAQPLYYAMYLIARHASGGHLLAASLRSGANIRAYATTACPTCAVNVFVINKDLKAAGPVQVSVEGRKDKATLLLLAAPSLASLAPEVRYGGSQFDSAGHLPAPRTSSVPSDARGGYTFLLPNASAAVLTVPAKP